MAKSPTTKLHKPPAVPANVPAAPAPSPDATTEVLMRVADLDIVIEDVGELDLGALRSTRVTNRALPFKGWFDKLQSSATWKEIFLPEAFWVDRDVKPEAKFARARVNKAFSEWVKASPDTRGKMEMRLVGRRKGDLNAQGKPYATDGISIFIRNPAAAI